MFSDPEERDSPIGVTLMARQPKGGAPKLSKLGCIADTTIFSVCILWNFCKRSLPIRSTLQDDNKLFLVYIQHEKQVPSSAKEATVANWVKAILEASGIDTTKFKAHSTRSAASTKAFLEGVDIKKLKQHANWSLNTDTFEKYCFKPKDQHQTGSSITTSLFGGQSAVKMSLYLYYCMYKSYT
jgi:hypothetical protein